MATKNESSDESKDSAKSPEAPPSQAAADTAKKKGKGKKKEVSADTTSAKTPEAPKLEPEEQFLVVATDFANGCKSVKGEKEREKKLKRKLRTIEGEIKDAHEKRKEHAKTISVAASNLSSIAAQLAQGVVEEVSDTEAIPVADVEANAPEAAAHESAATEAKASETAAPAVAVIPVAEPVATQEKKPEGKPPAPPPPPKKAETAATPPPKKPSGFGRWWYVVVLAALLAILGLSLRSCYNGCGEVCELSKKLSDAKASLAAITSERDQLQSDLDTAGKDKEKLKKRIAELERENKKLQDKIDDLEQMIDAITCKNKCGPKPKKKAACTRKDYSCSWEEICTDGKQFIGSCMKKSASQCTGGKSLDAILSQEKVKFRTCESAAPASTPEPPAPVQEVIQETNLAPACTSDDYECSWSPWKNNARKKSCTKKAASKCEAGVTLADLGSGTLETREAATCTADDYSCSWSSWKDNKRSKTCKLKNNLECRGGVTAADLASEETRKPECTEKDFTCTTEWKGDDKVKTCVQKSDACEGGMTLARMGHGAVLEHRTAEKTPAPTPTAPPLNIPPSPEPEDKPQANVTPPAPVAPAPMVVAEASDAPPGTVDVKVVSIGGQCQLIVGAASVTALRLTLEADRSKVVDSVGKFIQPVQPGTRFRLYAKDTETIRQFTLKGARNSYNKSTFETAIEFQVNDACDGYTR